MSPGTDDVTEDAPDSPEKLGTGVSSVVAWGRLQATTGQRRAEELLDRHRDHAVVDLGLRIYLRDRESAGSVVGGAVALRLFLFFVPLLVFVVGIAGFVRSHVGAEDVDSVGITGALARQINDALTQPSSSRWLAVGVGLIGMLTTGRTLSRVMAVASCLSWRLPPRPKATVRSIGGLVGLIAGIGLVTLIVNKIRHDLGFGVATVSFLAALVLYLVAWMLIMVLLPRATRDPGALLPGALLAALTLTTMQAVSQLYLPGRLSQASQVYGAIGMVVVTLGWFFFVGRSVVLALTLNAVVYERFGSISTFVFGLPVLRAIPRRWAWFRRIFQLEA